MSRYIATRAIRGANALVMEAEVMLGKALAEKGPDAKVGFPNTAYFLPTILGLTGRKVETVGDLVPVVEQIKSYLHPAPANARWTPYLGETLDAGVATLLATETIQALPPASVSPGVPETRPSGWIVNQPGPVRLANAAPSGSKLAE